MEPRPQGGTLGTPALAPAATGAAVAVTAACWGASNPVLKVAAERAARRSRGGGGPGAAAAGGAGLWGEWRERLAEPLFAGALAVNWLGSAVFYVALARGDFAVVGPCCNALGLGFTALAGRALGERGGPGGLRAAAGTALVMAGVLLCCWDAEVRAAGRGEGGAAAA